jgi:hypothetical protein
MLQRVLLSLAFGIAIAYPAFAADAVRLRVLSEGAYATQCRDGLCATVQVTRSTFSGGATETTLFVSAYDASGNPIIPGTFVAIDSSALVIDRHGTRATLIHPNATVTWAVTGDYREETNLATKIVDRRPPPAGPGPTVLRMREREHLEGAVATGTAGPETAPIAINTDVTPPTVGFADAIITIRKTIRIERSLDTPDQQTLDDEPNDVRGPLGDSH